MTFATILSIVSGVIALLKAYVSFSERQGWIEAGESRAVLKGLEDCEQSIKDARAARKAVRDELKRNPDSIMRDDKYQRPD